MARASRGEIKIQEILEMNGMPFQMEYEFADLHTEKGRPLRFDFAVFDDDGNVDFLIEFQGAQHYEPIKRFGGARGLARQRYNDRQKRIYCTKNQLPLVIIPHWEEHIVDYDYILNAAGVLD